MDNSQRRVLSTNRFREGKADEAQSSDAASIAAVSHPPDEEYSNHKKVGIALIFNHEKFTNQHSRVGTHIDRCNLELELKSFGFDVRVHNDYTLKELRAKLSDVAQEDHSENDCLVIVVMTHGGMGEVCAKDTNYPVDALWTPFLGNKCPSLINKPKIVIIEACRGNKVDSAVSVPMSGGRPAKPIKPVNYFIPSTADLLVFYSTFDGHPSFSSKCGSVFIQSLCMCLKEAAKSKEDIELLRFLTRVNRKVAYEHQVRNCVDKRYNNAKEMPTFVSTLTKLFYLKVKRN